MTFHDEDAYADAYWADEARADRWERAEERERAEEIERDRLTRDVPAPTKYQPVAAVVVPKKYRGGGCR